MSKLRELLHELADAVADHFERVGPEYYDQDTSPFSSQTHCRLVRSGRVPGFKVSGRVLVKRSDMHRFIESQAVDPNVALSSDEASEVDEALSKIGMRKMGADAA